MARVKGTLVSRILTAGQAERLAAAIRASPNLTHRAVAEVLGVSVTGVRVWLRERGMGPQPAGGRLGASVRFRQARERHQLAVTHLRKLLREAGEAGEA